LASAFSPSEVFLAVVGGAGGEVALDHRLNVSCCSVIRSSSERSGWISLNVPVEGEQARLLNDAARDARPRRAFVYRRTAFVADPLTVLLAASEAPMRDR
jgi:hypothetical protein